MTRGKIADRRSARRRAGLLFPALLATAGLLTACSTPANDESGELSERGPLAITWYGSDARNAAMMTVIDGFAAEHPDVEIQTQPTAWDTYWDRLSVQSAGESLPCVPTMQSRYEAKFEDLNALRPLDDLVESGAIDVSGIDPAILDSQRAADGKLYVIPFGIWYEASVYNQTAIEAVPAELPADDWSWDDYLEWAYTVQPDLAPGVWAIVDRGGQLTQFQTYLQGMGQELWGDGEVGFDAETLHDWFTMWDQAREDGVVSPAQLTAENEGAPPSQQLLATGQALVSSAGDNNVSVTQGVLDTLGAGTLDVAPTPTGGEPQGVGTNGWAISATCTNVTQAAAFISYFVNSEEGAIALAGQAGLPTVGSLLDDLSASPEVSEPVKARIDLYRQIADLGATVDVWPDGSQSLVNLFISTYEGISFGQSTIDEGVETFIGQANAALAGF